MADVGQTSSTANQEPPSRSTFLVHEILRRGQQEAANLLTDESEQTIATVLTLLPTAKAVALLPRFDAARRVAILKAVTPYQSEQWLHNQ
jgi:flagellar motor switch protein FliG